MSSAQLETFLARLYTDEAMRDRFLADPEAVARAAELQETDVRALAVIDRNGLQLAAAIYTHKREAGRRGNPLLSLLRRKGVVRN